jgi:methylglyoxal reductase
MSTAPLGTSGLTPTRIGLGCWAMGGEGWGGTDADAAEAAIRESLDQGVTLIDTAPIYGFGLSEEIVGRAIKGRRDEVVLSSKCGMVWETGLGEYFHPSSRGPIHRYLGRESVVRECHASLARLGTDYIDIYHTHFQEDVTPVAEVMQTLLDLQAEGLIRSIAISNTTTQRLLDYLAHGRIACVQEKYSMLDRTHEYDLFPNCVEHNVGVLAYSPLAMGLLTGKITQSRQFDEGDVRRGNARFTGESVEKVSKLLSAIEPVAASHDASIAQTVIAWTLSRPGITHVLCGARNPKQARENAVAGNLELTSAEIASITSAIDASDLHLPNIYED